MSNKRFQRREDVLCRGVGDICYGGIQGFLFFLESRGTSRRFREENVVCPRTPVYIKSSRATYCVLAVIRVGVASGAKKSRSLYGRLVGGHIRCLAGAEVLHTGESIKANFSRRRRRRRLDF